MSTLIWDMSKVLVALVIHHPFPFLSLPHMCSLGLSDFGPYHCHFRADCSGDFGVYHFGHFLIQGFLLPGVAVDGEAEQGLESLARTGVEEQAKAEGFGTKGEEEFGKVD